MVFVTLEGPIHFGRILHAFFVLESEVGRAKEDRVPNHEGYISTLPVGNGLHTLIGLLQRPKGFVAKALNLL